MKIAGIMRESVVDGPGVRFVVFAQGCVRRCKGCHNPDTWDPAVGQETTVRAVLKELRRAPESVRGLTISGGEPFLQARELAELAKRAHDMGLDVVTYTGYVYEDLMEIAGYDPDAAELLKQTDLLVDGPFVEELRDMQLRFRGSGNQRLIDMNATRRAGSIVIMQ